MTISSGTTLYLTAQQFLSYYDSRVVAELLSDSGVKVASPVSDPRLTELLKSACGEVEANALRGGRYTATDLAAIAATETHGAVYLRKLVATCAMNSLRSRRARVGEDALESYRWVERCLKELRNGESIFGFVEVQEAANISSKRDNRTQRVRASGISVNASPYFGLRGGDGRY